MTIQANDFQSNALSGNISVIEGKISLVLPTNTNVLEGDKQLIVKLRRDSIFGPVVVTTPIITLKDYSEILNISPNLTVMSEGDAVQFTITTANIADGSRIFFSTTGNVSYDDFVGGNVGYVTIHNNLGYANLIANADLTPYEEGDEVFQLQFRAESTEGPVNTTSANLILIRDSSNVVTITGTTLSSNVIYETESVSFITNALNATGPNVKTLYYSVEGNAVIASPTSGSYFISQNTGNLEIIAEQDKDANTKYFAVTIREDNAGGTLVYQSPNIIVNQYSTGDITPKISFVTSATTDRTFVTSGDTIGLTVNTLGATEGETLYYDTVGTVTSSSFTSGNTGSITLSSNTGTVPLTVASGVGAGESFAFNIRRGSSTGQIIANTGSIGTYTLGAFMDATGGTTEVIGSYKYHYFTESGEFNVTQLSTGPSARNVLTTLVVAGGGAGGSSDGNGVGGGGAGGLLNTTTPVGAGGYLVVVGGGGVGGPTGGGISTKGNDSFIQNNPQFLGSNVPINISATGGGAGRGRYAPTAYISGGSGGGGSAWQGTAGTGIPGQGFPGSPGEDDGSPPRGGAGGGAAAAGGSRSSTGAIGGAGASVPWVPASYGSPGRYFSGGGGGTTEPNQGGAGGIGGGGSGGIPTTIGPAPLYKSPSGVINTGGGGGAGAGRTGPSQGGDGGSGIIILRYLIS